MTNAIRVGERVYLVDDQGGGMALAISLGAPVARNALERLNGDVVLRGEREALIAAISANFRLKRCMAVPVN